MSELNTNSLSVVIPTYNRGEVLLETIELLLQQTGRADEILIVDQTIYMEGDPVLIKLQQLTDSGKITWVRLELPSIPNAMNQGLLLASSEFVLFLDDDVSFGEEFILAHRNALNQTRDTAHVGQILQPGELSEDRSKEYQPGQDLARDLSFPFRSNKSALLHNCMAGNLLVTRQVAIDCGGFDEQFSGAAYRFETEFCRRMIDYSGQPFYFVPEASLNHLKISTGGTREKVRSFLTSSSPSHSQGDYYFALRCGQNKAEIVRYVFGRFFGSCIARFYLQRPWWIFVRLLAEARGLVAAIGKIQQGQKLIVK